MRAEELASPLARCLVTGRSWKGEDRLIRATLKALPHSKAWQAVWWPAYRPQIRGSQTRRV